MVKKKGISNKTKNQKLEEFEVILHMLDNLDEHTREIDDAVEGFIEIDIIAASKVVLLGLIMAFKTSRECSASETYRVQIYEALEKEANKKGLPIYGEED